MITFNRRQFGGVMLGLGAQARRMWGATSGVDNAIRAGMAKHKIPTVVAMAATADRITYAGTFGKRDSASGIDLKPDSMFVIASMTKAITTTAALQLVERGKLKLQDPVSKHLPQLAKLEVLTGFDSAGKPMLRPASKPVTLHHLLTHTSGFVYDTWDANQLKYEMATGGGPAGAGAAPVTPLAFDPGTRWQYGTSLDWTGRLVEKVSGLTLEEYFQKNILQPLEMKDTSFLVPANKFDRLASTYRRQPDGVLKEDPRAQPAAPKEFNGGGGLYSTAPDYVRFMQMILKKGRGRGDDRILQAKTVEMMSANQIGNLGAGKLKTSRPAISADVDFHPGVTDKWGYGFLINTVAYPNGGRSAGSLAWAGVENTYYWIDPKKQICGVIMMQFFPFADPEAVAMLGEFERAVYANL